MSIRELLEQAEACLLEDRYLSPINVGKVQARLSVDVDTWRKKPGVFATWIDDATVDAFVRAPRTVGVKNVLKVASDIDKVSGKLAGEWKKLKQRIVKADPESESHLEGLKVRKPSQTTLKVQKANVEGFQRVVFLADVVASPGTASRGTTPFVGIRDDGEIELNNHALLGSARWPSAMVNWDNEPLPRDPSKYFSKIGKQIRDAVKLLKAVADDLGAVDPETQKLRDILLKGRFNADSALELAQAIIAAKNGSPQSLEALIR